MKLKKVLVALGFAVFIPITGCSQFTGVSKNCDELAQKYLEISFSQAAENNGEYTKQLAIVKSIDLVDIDKDGSNHKVANLTAYFTNSNGTIEPSPNFFMKLPPYSADPELTKPSILTGNQIVCQYNIIAGNRLQYLPNGNWIEGAYFPFGKYITVSEDNGNIYWKE